MENPTSFWKKTPLWVGAGIVIGALAMGTFISGSGLKLATAQSHSVQTKLANLGGAGLAGLEAMDNAFAEVSEAIAPSVVHIRWGDTGPTATRGGGAAEGSGFIYTSDGWIITNDHVVNGAKDVTVVLNDGRELKGTVRRSNDLQNDVALVKVDAKDLPTASIGDSGKVRMGQFALAFGAPFGLENTLTVGHISALGRATQAGDQFSTRNYTAMIQTDAPINPGNSGGPLMNIRGEVIGVNTSIYSGQSFMGQGGSVGIGFAIPINQVRLIADRLIKNGSLSRGFLGIAPSDLTPYEKKQLGVQEGAIIRAEPMEGPALTAGIKKGDIVTKIGQITIRGEQDLRNAMLDFKPGTKVQIELLRDGNEKTVTATVGELPESAKFRSAPQQQQQPRGNFNPFGGDGSEDPLSEMPRFRKFFEGPGPQKGKPSPDVKVQGGPAKLGVELRVVGEADKAKFNVPASTKGLIIATVVEGSVAESLGLEAGDVITELNGVALGSVSDLSKAMASKKVGDLGRVKVQRFSEGGQSQMDLSFKY